MRKKKQEVEEKLEDGIAEVERGEYGKEKEGVRKGRVESFRWERRGNGIGEIEGEEVYEFITLRANVVISRASLSCILFNLPLQSLKMNHALRSSSQFSGPRVLRNYKRTDAVPGLWNQEELSLEQ